MSKIRSVQPRRKVRAASPAPLISTARLKPVADPFRARGGRVPDPDELPPACPRCRSAFATLWFIDARTTKAHLICLDCEAYVSDPADIPDADVPLEFGKAVR